MQTLAIHQPILINNVGFLSKSNKPGTKKNFEKADHVWSYLGKILLLTRHLLNAASKSCQLTSVIGKNFPEKVRITTTRLKLFSIVGVPFSLVSLKSVSEKIFKSLRLNDKEAVALSSLSFTVIAIDVLDSITTFVNAVLVLSSRAPIASLSALGLPFGFAMSGLGTISRIIQIAKACQVYKSVSAVRKEMLEGLLQKKLGGTEKQAKIAAHLTGKTLNAIPGDIGLKLHKLHTLITLKRSKALTDQEISEISQILDDIQDELKRKLTIEGLGMVANTLIISALSLFSLGSLSSTPFLLLASSFFIRISSLTYQNAGLTKG